MKIAVSTKDGHVDAISEEFSQFSIFDIEPETRTVRAKLHLTLPTGHRDEIPDSLHNQGVNTVLTGRLDTMAQERFRRVGLEVVKDLPPYRVEAVVARYLMHNL